MIDCTFHETKSERKFYEGKKQKALTIINNSISNVLTSDRFNYGKSSDGKYVIGMLHRISDLVNDI